VQVEKLYSFDLLLYMKGYPEVVSILLVPTYDSFLWRARGNIVVGYISDYHELFMNGSMIY